MLEFLQCVAYKQMFVLIKNPSPLHNLPFLGISELQNSH